MSVVERALRNLKQAAAAQEPAARQSIARVTSAADGAVADENAGGMDRRALDRRAPDRRAADQDASDQRAMPDGRPAHDAAPPLALQPGRAVEFDLEALRQAGLYATGNERLADEYRIIKRPLLKTATERGASGQERTNLLMVASALPGEGKTFTSVNLSMSLASEKDWQVLLVDVDCKNPQLSELLGVGDEPGLLDLLRDSTMTLDSVVMGTNIEHLCVLPLGTPGEDAAELLASGRMSDLCSSLSDGPRKRFVVFDSSPLLLTTEPIVLSGQIGQIVIVVNAFQTPREAVTDAVGKLDENLAIGLVLNRMNPEDNAMRYGSYGRYGSYPYSKN